MPKRLTTSHWEELRKTDPHDPRLRFGYGRDHNRLDADAQAAGYEPGEGAFRPWFRRHVMGMVALTGDGDAFEVISRLNEIAQAQKEVGPLTITLREWLAVTELVARVRGDV